MWKIGLFLSFLVVAGCSEDRGSDGDRTAPGKFVAKPGDLSQIPIDQAIRTKYKRLQFVCDYQLLSLRESSLGRVAKTEVVKQFHIWDLIEDFNDKVELELDYKFEDTRVNATWNFEVKWVSLAKPKMSDRGKETRYFVRDAVVLKGDNTTHFFEYDEKGVDPNSANIELYDLNYYDRVPFRYSIGTPDDSANNPRNTQIHLNCFLDAEVRKGFEEDYKVLFSNN